MPVMVLVFLCPLFLAAVSPASADTPTTLVKLRSAGDILVTLEEGRRQVVFTDSVVFDYGGYHMKAGRLTLDEAIGRAWAEGGLHLNGPAGLAYATEAYLDLPTERIVLRNINVHAGPWSAFAEEANVEGQQMVLQNVNMTVCPVPNPLYSLRIRQLSRESPERYVARGVSPYFYFIPFFYFPKYTYELERTEEGALVPSRQGFEFRPGRGNFTGLFVRSLWRKKFFDRRLESALHLDYYGKPGPAVGEEFEYRTQTTDHFTFAYFTRQRNINHDNFSRASGRTNRGRLWQTWTKKWASGHFKSFVNEATDSLVESDYRLDLDERRLRDREINMEFVYDKPNLRAKLLGERLNTLSIGGSKEYALERRLAPGFRVLTFPIPLARSEHLRLYGQMDVTAARGRDRGDREDGELGSGQMRAHLSSPIGAGFSATVEAGIQNEYHKKKIAAEKSANTQTGKSRLTFHRGWWGNRFQTDAGYSFQKALSNESIYASTGGQIENLAFLSLRKFSKIVKTSLDGGWDLRPGRRELAVVDFSSRAAWPLGSVSTISRYDPDNNRIQSVYASGSINLWRVMSASMGFQSVHLDTETQVQFSPRIDVGAAHWIYRFAFSALYDAAQNDVRETRLAITRAFSCIDTTMEFSKNDNDFQFNFRFRLTGFERGGGMFRSSTMQ